MPRRKSKRRHYDHIKVKRHQDIARSVFHYDEDRLDHIHPKHSFVHDTRDHKKKQHIRKVQGTTPKHKEQLAELVDLE